MLSALHTLSLVIGWLSAAYLLWRTVASISRIRWARHAYPTMLAPGTGTAGDATGDRQDRSRGAVIGLAIGDALCLPAESIPRWLARLRYPGGPRMRRGILRITRRAGDVSDDTQLTIAVARSIQPDGRYCHERFVDELARWSYFRVGAGRACTRAAIHARRNHRPGGQASEGNGVAIRVAPLAIAIEDQAALLEVVRENALATHTSDVAIRAGAFVALLISECLRSPPGLLDDGDSLRHAIQQAAVASAFSPYTADGEVPATLRAPSGHVNDSIPAAVSILLAHGSDMTGAMTAAFAAGGDCDSIAAIVGACIGAQVGYRALPEIWRSSVQHHDYLVWLADRLAGPTGLAGPEPSPHHGGAIVEVSGDIARREVDAIVNAWNRNVIPPYLLLPQGVSGALKSAGGRSAIRAVGRTGPLPLGNAIETTAGSLPARWVIHADAIDLSWRASERSVRRATRSALQLAIWLGARSVALPLLGSGSGGLSPDTARTIITEEAERFRDELDRIEIVSFARKREPAG